MFNWLRKIFGGVGSDMRTVYECAAVDGPCVACFRGWGPCEAGTATTAGCDHNHANDGFYVPRVSADELSGRI